MNCEKCAEDLTSLVFDELSEESSIIMHEHIAECDSCRDSYLELIETQASLESVLTENSSVAGLGVDQKRDILEAVNTPVLSSTEKKAPMAFPSWLFAAAACLIIGIIFVKNNRSLPEADVAKTEEASEKAEQKAEQKSKQKSKPEAKSDYLSEVKPKMNRKSEGVMADKEMLDLKKKPEALVLESEELSDLAKEPAEKDKKSSTKRAKLMDIKQDKKSLSEDLPSVNKALVEENEKVDVAKAEEAKKDVAGGPLQEAKAQRAALFSGNIQSITFDSFAKMLVEYSKTEGLDKDVVKTLNDLQAFKKDQLQLSLSSQKGAKNTTEQKILVRILDNAKKAIDYAHIFVHNQKIIRVERVR